MAGFYNTLSPYFLHFPISAQPSPAEKLTVLLIFDMAKERTKKKKRKKRGKERCFAWDGELAPYRHSVICGGVKHLASLFR